MNMYSVTDLRHKTKEVIESAIENDYVHIIQNSKAKVVLVDSGYFEAARDAYEDYLDVQEFDRTIDEPRVSLEDHLKQYNKKKK